MHIVLGLLTGIAGLIWAIVALQRTGFSLDSLNPFAWYRRHQWTKTYGGKPIYKLSDPVDVAGVLLLGILKCEGEISSAQKQTLLDLFERTFHMSPTQASDLLLASSHLLRDELYISDNASKILEPSWREFDEAKVNSLLALMAEVAALEGALNDEQKKLMAAVEDFYRARKVLSSARQW